MVVLPFGGPGCQETFRSIFNNLYFPIGWGCLGTFPPKRNWNQKHSDEAVSRSLEIYFCIVLRVITLRVTLVNLPFWSPSY